MIYCSFSDRYSILSFPFCFFLSMKAYELRRMFINIKWLHNFVLWYIVCQKPV